MRIALVKQDCLNDLYVSSPQADPKTKILSTLMRVGPSGLFTIFNADFFIVHEENDQECQHWTKRVRRNPEWFRRFNKVHSTYVKSSSDINWGNYDIVISLNISVPARITTKFRKTLWCYVMMNPPATRRIAKGYDVQFKQDISNKIPRKFGTVPFPYSFIEPRSLLNMVTETPEPAKRSGVYLDPYEYKVLKANNEQSVLSQFGPVRTFVSRVVNGVEPYAKQSRHMHQTLENLSLSKYWVKTRGRIIRGDSPLSAIACRCLVLITPQLWCYGKQFMSHAQGTHRHVGRINVASDKQAIELISRLEDNDDAYYKLLQDQEDVFQRYIIDNPVKSLKKLLHLKLS